MPFTRNKQVVFISKNKLAIAIFRNFYLLPVFL